jgi:hypothetical protein
MCRYAPGLTARGNDSLLTAGNICGIDPVREGLPGGFSRISIRLLTQHFRGHDLVVSASRGHNRVFLNPLITWRPQVSSMSDD